MVNIVKYSKTAFAMTLLVISLLIISFIPIAIGESSGGGNQNEWQGGNDEANKNGSDNSTQEQSQDQTQEQKQNGTCNNTGNSTQEQSQDQTQEQKQNGTCSNTYNGTQEQSQDQTQEQKKNGACDNTGNGTQEQSQDQNRDQEQKQDGTCDENGSNYQNMESFQSMSGPNEGNMHQWRHQYREQIQQGAENGSLIMETTFSRQDGTMVQENNHYQLGMDIVLEEAMRNRVQIRVSAEFQEGKTIAINMADDVLDFENLGDIKVTFDGDPIEIGTVEEVLEEQGTEAKYIVALEKEGAQFLIYIPHFSEHTISIESLVELAKEKIFTQTNYMVMALGIIILIGISGHIYTIGKSRK